MSCLNSIIELIGRIKTMLRIFRASTPVESFCDVVRIVDLNGGIERMRGPAAADNIAFQVTAGSLSGPASKWKPEQFYDTGPLEAALKQLGRK